MLFIINPEYKHISSPISSFHVHGLKTAPIHTLVSYPETDGYMESHNTAKRIIERIKYYFQEPGSATKERLDELWGDVVQLEKTRVRRKNIEDNCALYMSAAFFQDERMQRRAGRRLSSQLKEMEPTKNGYIQELLLDCINIGERMGVNGQSIRDYLKSFPLSQGTIQDYANRLYIK